MNLIARLAATPFIGWLLRHRYIKFGTVGATGVVVNLAVLYVAQEYLLTFVEPPSMRLNASLAVAIFFATINNFTWNRIWTWADRKQHHVEKSIVYQFGQYALACWLGIALQVVITKLLAFKLHYLVANLIAIVAASIFNFVVNDLWTFRRLKLLAGPQDNAADASHQTRREE
jgi:putative flippase GtrA